MNSGGKKGIIIAIVVIILIIALAIGGFFVYATTDLLKSNQTLFFKYAKQALESAEYTENSQTSQIQALKEEMPYTLTGKVNFETENGTNTNILNNMEINIDANVNKPEEKAYAKTTITNNNQTLFTLEYANNDNTYALKSDEIVTAFLGIENENLKVLMQKCGLPEGLNIPNEINNINVNNLFSITEEEKNHIIETYSSVLMQNINKDNFSKNTNLTISKDGITYNTTAYRLNLNSEELKQVQITILQTLIQDSITLNYITTKAKSLGLDENYTQINSLANEIQNQINKIQNTNYPSNEGISIAIYVDAGKVITTEIILRNEIKFTIYAETIENTTTRYLLIEDLNEDLQYYKVELKEQETKSNNVSTYNITVNLNDDIDMGISISNNGTAEDGLLSTNYEISISGLEDLNYIITYEQEIEFTDDIDDIIELNSSNCAILNNYSTDQIRQLLESIFQRILVVLEEKKQAIGWQEYREEDTEENQDITLDTEITTPAMHQNNVDNNEITNEITNEMQDNNIQIYDNVISYNNTTTLE